MSTAQTPQAGSSQERPAASTATVADTELQGGAIGLPAVLMQAITHIGPAIGLATSIAFIVSLAGKTAPLAYGFAFLIVLAIGASLTQLANRFPSAGGYFTYTSRTLHPRAGLLTSWLYFLYDPLGGCINLAFFGFILEGLLKSKYNFEFPWWLTFIITAAIISYLVYRGIKISATVMLILGILEILIFIALAITALISPGSGGTNFAPFNLANAPANGLYLAVVFSILTFSGFESVAPLAEESRSPRRILPRAIMLSIVIMGIFFLLTSWAIVAGWGTHRIGGLATSAQNPILVVAERVWGIGWVLVMFAIFNSALAVAIACTNASTRVFFAMGRVGVLPKWLARVHHKVPVNAVTLQTIITFAYGLGIGFWIGADQEFYFTGVAITLGLIFIYGAGNIGVISYYLREARDSFNIWLNAIFPIACTIALIWVGYKSVVPLPAAPVKYAPFVVAGWLVAGLVLMWALSRRGREDWLIKASEIAYERPPTPEEVAAEGRI
jgi:amino acid transporter